MKTTFGIKQENTTTTEIIGGRVFLVCSDGTRQPLTKQECIWLHMGLYTLDFLDKKYNSEPTRGC